MRRAPAHLKQQTVKALNAQPLYMKLRDVLLGRISSGEWSPGQSIPNEIELARQYGLSSGTVRKALDWMDHAKIIVRIQGRGTFILDPASEAFVNWYERLRSADGTPHSGEVGAASVIEAEANAYECKRLHLEPGALVRRTTRLHLLHGNPYMTETSVVAAALFPLHPDSARADHALLELAKICGVMLGKGEEHISAENATVEMAALLACADGDALLRLDRTVFTINDQPAEWRVAYSRLKGQYYSTVIGRELTPASENRPAVMSGLAEPGR